MHQRPITYEGAPRVVARAALDLTCKAHQGQAKALMRNQSSQARARALLEALYREEPNLNRERAINRAARVLAEQATQISPS